MIGLSVTLVLLVLVTKIFKQPKKIEQMKEKIMWNSFFRGQLQMYFPTCLITIGAIKTVSLTNLSANASHFVKLTILLFIPGFSYFFLKSRIAQASSEAMLKRYGTLYTNVKPGNRGVYLGTTLFCLRRLMVASCTILWPHLTVVAIYVNFYGSLITLIFIIELRPMNTKALNRIEILNEVFMMFSTYFLITLSEFIPSSEMR